MIPGWFVDLLLESPAPPPNWLPDRNSRLADARLTLRRRFGEARATNRASHHLRDIGWPYPFFGGTRVVSGSEIEADVEQDITTVNPPNLQGWAWLALVAAIVGEVAGLVVLQNGDLLGALALFIGCAAVWLLVVAVVGMYQREVALASSGVVVRRWTDVWLGRSGVRLGEPVGVSIRHVGTHRISIASEHATMTLDMRLWPPSARQDLADEPPLWGVRMEHRSGDRHHRRHPHPE